MPIFYDTAAFCFKPFLQIVMHLLLPFNILIILPDVNLGTVYNLQPQHVCGQTIQI